MVTKFIFVVSARGEEGGDPTRGVSGRGGHKILDGEDGVVIALREGRDEDCVVRCLGHRHCSVMGLRTGRIEVGKMDL